jgi:hypothetical protein
VWDAVAADVKHKEFWVEGCDPPTKTSAPTTTSIGPDTSTTTTIGT